MMKSGSCRITAVLYLSLSNSRSISDEKNEKLVFFSDKKIIK